MLKLLLHDKVLAERPLPLFKYEEGNLVTTEPIDFGFHRFDGIQLEKVTVRFKEIEGYALFETGELRVPVDFSKFNCHLELK